MDDGKRENNKIRRLKSENVKSVVSVYLHRRQFTSLKARRISKKTALKRARIDNRISRSNSILYSCYSSDPLVIEYSFMFEKFMYWLKDQTEYKHRCYELEKLVGPLFCHLYMDIRSSGQSDKAVTFYKAHIDKVDKSKCDDLVKDILKTLACTSDTTIVNGTDSLNYEELKAKFRSSRVVTEIKLETLVLLKKFVAESSHIVFLQALQNWFDLRIRSENNDSNDLKDDVKKSKLLHLKHESKEQLANKQEVKDQKNKIKGVIRKVKKLPSSVCNIRILNSKGLVTCGFVNRQVGLVAFAERNILRIMPDDVCGEQVDHIRFIHHSRQIYCIVLAQKSDILCTGSADRSICVYSLNKVILLKRLLGHLGSVYCVAISDNSKYLVSGSQDSTARLWGLRSGKTLRIFAGHTDAITSVHFHPNTMYVATGSADKNVRIWCLKTANTVRLLHAAKREIYSVAFDPNGLYIACASDDKKLRIWDLASSKIVNEFKNRESSVFHLLWSKNGKQLCGGTISGVVKVWEITHHHRDRDKDKDHKHSEPVLRRRVNGRLLSLEYTMGTWTCLSVPKIGYSPFDNL